MRSELVFGAMTQVPHRLLLVGLASKATRILHRPNSCIQETMNDVFERFRHGSERGTYESATADRSRVWLGGVTI
jgi:hypothetical protein